MKRSIFTFLSILLIGVFAPNVSYAGCNDPAACNFEPLDTDNFDCTYPGCIDFIACNYDPLAGCDDGTCMFFDQCENCGGFDYSACTDPAACNYDPVAGCDDGSCFYQDACSECGGGGIVAGCTDLFACNFNPEADCDDGSCCFDNCLSVDMTDSGGDGWQGATYSITDAATLLVVASGDLDGANEGDGLNFGTDFNCLSAGCYIFDVGGGSNDDEIGWTINGADEVLLTGGDGSFNFSILTSNCFGCSDWEDCNYNPLALYEDNSCIGPPGCTDPIASNYDSNAGCDDGSCIVCPLGQSPFVIDMWDTGGNGWGGAQLTIQDEFGSPVVTETLVSGSSGQATYCLADGCYEVITNSGTAPMEITYELEVFDALDDATVFGVADDNQAFAVGGTRGCTDPTAYNYDASVMCDDGSCFYCTEDQFCNAGTPEACNSINITGEGFIHLSRPGERNFGTRIRDLDDLLLYLLWVEFESEFSYILRCQPGLDRTLEIEIIEFDYTIGEVVCYIITIDDEGGCDVEEYDWLAAALGCVDSTACNFDPLANVDDGSCNYPGCIDPTALNYDSLFFCDDGSCVFIEGCTDVNACNYFEDAVVDDGSCTYGGCTYLSACNYDPVAACDDGSCLYGACTDPLALNFAPAALCDDGSCVYLQGCTNASACNYNAEALIDDGSCEFGGCTLPEACNYDPVATCDDGSCDFSGCVGCTYNGATNFDPLALIDDGSCLFDTVAVCPADTNGDCLVNTTDLLSLLSFFGTACDPCD